MPRFERPLGVALAVAGAFALLLGGVGLRSIAAAALLAAGSAGAILLDARAKRLGAAALLVVGLALAPNPAPAIAALAGALLFAGLLVGTTRHATRAIVALLVVLAALAAFVFAGQSARAIDVPGVASLLVFSTLLLLLAALVALGRRLRPGSVEA